MIPEPILSLGSRLTKVFRVFGKLEFIRRLHDFLVHEGRRSRAQTLAQTAEIVLQLEKAEAQRIKNSKALMELMQTAGFPDEKIQAVLCDPKEMQRVSAALTTMLHYVDTGAVTITVISDAESDKANSSTILENSLVSPPPKGNKRQRRGQKKVVKRGDV